ncbi:MAG: bifunctional oligoribonuclease/PAP phosphatase NrnA [Flavobacteriaceae bacterium]|nr:bifunctional oligoribonuclease/PAP phosphatase NrnA [Flavobacteriaceae bacterium]
MNLTEETLLKERLSKPQKIAVVGHKNPDGDAVGSCLALAQVLKKLKHQVQVIFPDAFPYFLNFLPETNRCLYYDQQPSEVSQCIDEASLIFTLDFNDLKRVGDLSLVLSQAKADFVMIDHHIAPADYARFTYSDIRSSSTAEMVYHFLYKMDALSFIDASVADCLYTGIMTDTGSFRFPNTSAETHRIIADLIDKGAQKVRVHESVYDVNSPERIQLLGCALQNLRLLSDFRTAYISLSQEELDRYHYQKGFTEGFVNYGLSIENIVFAILFSENKRENMIKISFRSKGNFSVNNFARAHFEGGGHQNAAGGKSTLSLEDTIKKCVSLLPDYKQQLLDA